MNYKIISVNLEKYLLNIHWQIQVIFQLSNQTYQMQTQKSTSREKQNANTNANLHNSKLSMSIKPFTTVREDLLISDSAVKRDIPSKSVEKTKKGLARVYSGTNIVTGGGASGGGSRVINGDNTGGSTNNKYLFTSLSNFNTQDGHMGENSGRGKTSGNNQNHLPPVLPNKRENQNGLIPLQTSMPAYRTQQPPYPSIVIRQPPIEQQNLENFVKNLTKNLQVLEVQQVVLEKENTELQTQVTMYKELMKQLKEEILEKTKYYEKCLEDKKEEITHKDSMIERLLNEGKSVKSEHEEGIRNLKDTYERKIEGLLQQIQKLEKCMKQLEKEKLQNIAQQKIYSQQEQPTPTFHTNDQENMIRKMRGQNIQLREKNRQLLVRCNALENQKQTKNDELAFQVKQTSKLSHIINQLQKQIEGLLHQLRISANQGNTLQKQNQQLKYQLQSQQASTELMARQQQKIRELEARRISQIEYHQNEIRRIEAVKNEKIEIHKKMLQKELEGNRREINQLKEALRQKQINLVGFEHRQATIVEGMTKDYEKLLYDIKQKVDEKDRLNKQTQRKANLELGKKQREIEMLNQRVKDLTEEKELLLRTQNRDRSKERQRDSIGSIFQGIRIYGAQQQKQKVDHQAIVKQEQRRIIIEKQRISKQEQILQLKEQLQMLSQINKQISTKIKSYEMEMLRMEEKIHSVQVQSQLNRERVSTTELKNRQLQEEIRHYEAQKSSSMKERIVVMEEIQSLKHDKIAQDEALKQLQKKFKKKLEDSESLKSTIQELLGAKGELIQTISNLKRQVHIKDQLAVSLQEQNQILEERNKSLLSKIQQKKQQSMLKDQEIIKMKEYIDVLKKQLQIQKQKQKVKEYISRKQDNDEQELRIELLKKVFDILGGSPGMHQDKSKEICETDYLQQLVKLGYESIQKINERDRCVLQLDRRLKEKQQLLENQNTLKQLLRKNQQKCLDYEKLISEIETSHKEKLILVKEDYDVVYAKYLKYRNMVLMSKTQNAANR